MNAKDKLLKSLIDEGYLKTPAIIEAFKVIDRAEFVPEEYKSEAYANYPLPIGYGQTISQPLTVAFMLELLAPKKGERVLDVGAGSGWQTALLAAIVGEPPLDGQVIAIERIPALKEMAEKNLSKYNFIKKGIARVVLGDGSKGFEEARLFDKIIAAAAANRIPEAWQDELKIGGRIVAPVGNSIIVLDKLGPGKFSKKQYFGFSFVPLIEE